MNKYFINYLVIICPFLFSIFPIIYIYENNLQEIYFNQLGLPILFVILVNLILLVIFKWKKVIRETISLIIICAWCFIFFYQSFNKIIQITFVDNILPIRYTILSWLISITFIFFLMKKNKIILKKIILIFSIFLLFLNIISISKIFHKQYEIGFINKNKKNNYIVKKEIKNNVYDIYCIILDGYPGNEILKNNFFYDNSEFINNLKERKFNVFLKSRSNYTITFLSIASLLNFEYINYLSNKINIYKSSRIPAYELIQNNKVMQFLKEKNYKIINISSGWGATDHFENIDRNIKFNKYISEFSTILINISLLKEIFYFTGLVKNSNYINISYSLENIIKIKEVRGPKFVLAHILAPHDSYIFNIDGKPAEYDNQNNIIDKKKYTKSLNVLNNKVIKIIKSLLNESKNEPIIIIQSDHGSSSSFIPVIDKWEKPDRENIHERINNFTAFYLPGKLEKISDTISPVNTFRIIFNKYFNENLTLLPNRYYFSNYNEPYNFIEFKE